MATPPSDERIAEIRGRLSQTEPLYYCQLTGSEVHSLLDEVERLRAREAELKCEVNKWVAYGDNRVDVIGVYQQRNAALVEVLRSVEWEGEQTTDANDDYWPTCPQCGCRRPDGHAPDCALAAALRDETPTT